MAGWCAWTADPGRHRMHPRPAWQQAGLFHGRRTGTATQGVALPIKPLPHPVEPRPAWLAHPPRRATPCVAGVPLGPTAETIQTPLTRCCASNVLPLTHETVTQDTNYSWNDPSPTAPFLHIHKPLTRKVSDRTFHNPESGLKHCCSGAEPLASGIGRLHRGNRSVFKVRFKPSVSSDGSNRLSPHRRLLST